MPDLLAQPRWLDAAQALADGCVDLADDEARVALLERICGHLGDELYPAFLRVLGLVGQLGEQGARGAVARALVHALRTGRLPSGRRQAWGAGAGAPAAAYAGARSLGPIEYLCVWHAQAEGAQALPAPAFDALAIATLGLVEADADARALYARKLQADADDPLPGALTRRTRQALRDMATAWAGGAAATDAVARFRQALDAGGSAGSSLGLLARDRFFAAR